MQNIKTLISLSDRGAQPLRRCTYMESLYSRPRLRLEIICRGWHLTTAGALGLRKPPFDVSQRLHQAARLRNGTRRKVSEGAPNMLDLLMLAVGVGFFALSVGYAYACDRL